MSQAEDSAPADWKLRLRYGKLETEYAHYTLLAPGELAGQVEWSECAPGPAILALKMWAASNEQAFALFESAASDIGFAIMDKIELYETPPDRPPGSEPFTYSPGLTAFDR